MSNLNNSKSYIRYNLNQFIYIYILYSHTHAWVSKQTLLVFPIFPLEMTCGGYSKGNIWWVLLRVSLVQFFEVGLLKKLSFQKVHHEKRIFQKTEYLVKIVKKCFLKKLNVWLALIKVAVWVVNYQKRKCICKVLWKYFLFFFFIKLSNFF